MTAPTREEIRLTTLREWTRWRTGEHDARGPAEIGTNQHSGGVNRDIRLSRPERDEFPLSGRFDEIVSFWFTNAVSTHLWDLSERDDLPLDAIVDEIVRPVIAEAEASILEAVATALERFAAEYPNAPRARVTA